MNRRALRVLYINHISLPVGSVRSLRFLIEGFPAGTVEAYVLTPTGPADDEFRAAGARVLPVPAVSLFQNIRGIPVKGMRWGTVVRAVWHLRHGGAIRRAIRDVQPDLVHLNEHGMYQAARIARLEGKPVVMHVRCVADRDSWWQNRFAERYMTRHVDRIVAIDESVRRSMDAPAAAHVIYNPLGPCIPEPPLPEAGRSPMTAVFLAGLADFKGIEDLLDCAILLKGRKDVVFRLYGENRYPDSYYASIRGRIGAALGMTRDFKRILNDRITRNGLQDTVRLMGHVPAEAGVFRDADVVLFPSRLNGVGRSIFEGGLHGRPGIVTLHDRIEDIVRDGETGFIVPERNPVAMAAALTKLADGPALRRRMGETARALYRVQFDAHQSAARVLDLYRELLEQPRS